MWGGKRLIHRRTDRQTAHLCRSSTPTKKLVMIIKPFSEPSRNTPQTSPSLIRFIFSIQEKKDHFTVKRNNILQLCFLILRLAFTLFSQSFGNGEAITKRRAAILVFEEFVTGNVVKELPLHYQPHHCALSVTTEWGMGDTVVFLL